MALAATVNWEVRTTGNDTNGGGFDVLVTSPGTDYSQQDSPQIVYTDLVIGGTNTHLTSAGNPFTSAHVGNIINITSGTNFTLGRYEVLSVTTGTATMDRAVGTASSTGGHGNLGGGLLTPGAAATASVANNVIWLQSGTYTITTTITGTVAYSIVGYNATHGDNGTAPTITTSTNSTHLIQKTGGTALWTHNINFTNTAGTPNNAINNISASTVVGIVSNCTFTGFNIAVAQSAGNLNVFNSWFHGCAQGISAGCQGINLYACVISSCTSAQGAVQAGGNDCSCNITRCIIAGNSGDGFRSSGVGIALRITDSSIANNSGYGINMATAGWYAEGLGVLVQNNIIYGNGNFGIRSTAAYSWSTYITNNAMGSNTNGNYQNITAISTVALSAGPFTNSGGGDYSLNSTAGGGAACRGAGIPGVFPNGTTTQHIDIGGVNTTVSGGGGTTTYAFLG